MRRQAFSILVVSLVTAACGSSGDEQGGGDLDSAVDDAALDAGGTDSGRSDGGADVAEGGGKDSTVGDAPADAVGDSTLDAPADAPADAPSDGGTDARDAVVLDTATDARADGGCSSNADCASDEMCDAPTCTGPGTCVKKPSIGVFCRFDADMWCGCNGTDYQSVCAAHKAGVRVERAGACSTTACGATGDCASLGADYACSFGVGNCTVPGFCKAEALCPGVLSPYCDCAGANVSTNTCRADKDGTRLASSGGCP